MIRLWRRDYGLKSLCIGYQAHLAPSIKNILKLSIERKSFVNNIFVVTMHACSYENYKKFPLLSLELVSYMVAILAVPNLTIQVLASYLLSSVFSVGYNI